MNLENYLRRKKIYFANRFAQQLNIFLVGVFAFHLILCGIMCIDFMLSTNFETNITLVHGFPQTSHLITLHILLRIHSDINRRYV